MTGKKDRKILSKLSRSLLACLLLSSCYRKDPLYCSDVVMCPAGMRCAIPQHECMVCTPQTCPPPSLDMLGCVGAGCSVVDMKQGTADCREGVPCSSGKVCNMATGKCEDIVLPICSPTGQDSQGMACGQYPFTGPFPSCKIAPGALQCKNDEPCRSGDACPTGNCAGVVPPKNDQDPGVLGKCSN